jgi:tetratricopeptide (TPR) repeat protein
MPAPRRVFVSHTSELAGYPENRSFVDAAVSASLRAGDAPSSMEYFTAQATSTTAYSIAEVQKADIYVAIVGFRYGTPVRDRPTMSYTELEFQAAGAHGLPRLVFMLDERQEVPLPAHFTHDPEYQQRQQAFRDAVLASGVTVALFDTPDRLELLLTQALLSTGSTLPGLSGGADVQAPAGAAGSLVGRSTAELVSEGETLVMNWDMRGAALVDEVINRPATTSLEVVARGRALLLRGRPGEALAQLEPLARMGDGFALAQRAEVYIVLGRTGDAMEDIEKALKIGPRIPYLFLVRGMAHQLLNHRSRAKRDYDRALKTIPNYAYAHYARGQLEALEGEFDAALADFSAALQLTPNNVDTLIARGWVYHALRRYGEAEVDFRRALTLNPNHPAALNGCRAVDEAKRAPRGLARLFHRL